MLKDEDGVCPVWFEPAAEVCHLGNSGIHKGHRNVPDTSRGGQTFVVVGEATRVHEGPAFTRRLNGAVVAKEPASTTLQPIQHTY